MPMDVYEERMFEASGGLEGYALRAMNEMDHYDELERQERWRQADAAAGEL